MTAEFRDKETIEAWFVARHATAGAKGRADLVYTFPEMVACLAEMKVIKMYEQGQSTETEYGDGVRWLQSWPPYDSMREKRTELNNILAAEFYGDFL